VVLRVPSGSRSQILEVLDAYAAHVERLAGSDA